MTPKQVPSECLDSRRFHYVLFYITGCRGNPGPDIQELWSLSKKCFEIGVKAFDGVDDTVNMALVHSNRLVNPKVFKVSLLNFLLFVVSLHFNFCIPPLIA